MQTLYHITPEDPSPLHILASRFPTSITSSILDDWDKCPQLFWQRYALRLSIEAGNPHLVAGAAFASGLAVARKAYYLESASAEKAKIAGIRTLLTEWESDNDGAPKKPIDAMVEALSLYLDQWPFANDALQPYVFNGEPAIEFSFACELPILHPTTGEPILYEGRCDMIAENSGNLFVTDEKTTGYMGEQWASQFRIRGQFIGYCWGAAQYGYPVSGVFVRGIGLRKDGPIFAQVPIMIPRYLIMKWYDSLIAKVDSMVEAWNTHTFPYNFGHACTAYGGCSFADRCASQFPDRIPGFIQKDKLYYER